VRAGHDWQSAARTEWRALPDLVCKDITPVLTGVLIETFAAVRF
jgi:hypothetical protein